MSRPQKTNTTTNATDVRATDVRPRRFVGGLQSSERQGIKSIDIAGRVLAALCVQNAVSLKDLSAATRIAPAKLHRYLASLMNIGFVQQDADTRRYWLGPFAIEIGAAATRASDDLTDVIARQIRLRNDVDETISLSVWSSSGPIIVHLEESSRPVVMTMKVGTVLPVLATAAGIVFASLLPESATSALLDAEFGRIGPDFNPIVRSRRSLQTMAATVRARRYVYNKGHLLPGVGALAAPLFNRSGQLIGVFSVMGRDRDIDPARDKSMLTALLQAATSEPSVRRT